MSRCREGKLLRRDVERWQLRHSKLMLKVGRKLRGKSHREGRRGRLTPRVPVFESHSGVGVRVGIESMSKVSE